MIPPLQTPFVIIARVLKPVTPGDRWPYGDPDGEEIKVLHNKFWATIQGVDNPVLCYTDSNIQDLIKAAETLLTTFPTLFNV